MHVGELAPLMDRHVNGANKGFGRHFRRARKPSPVTTSSLREETPGRSTHVYYFIVSLNIIPLDRDITRDREVDPFPASNIGKEHTI